MSLLLLWAGTSSGAAPPFTPLTFNDITSVLLPDEVAVGQQITIYAQIVQNSGPQTLSEPAQFTIYGFTSSGVRTVVQATAQMTQVGGNDLWSGTWTPSAAGVYEVVVAMNHTSVHAASVPLTVRAKFDPIGLAIDDVMVSRMDGESPLGTA